MKPEENSHNTNINPNSSAYPIPVKPEPAVLNPQKPNSYTYADFGSRLAAYIIDTIIIYIPMMILFIPLITFIAVLPTSSSIPNNSMMRNYDYSYSSDLDPKTSITLVFIILFTIFASIAVYYMYFSIFESSKWQATPGKKIMGLIVTDEEGNKLTFGKAFVRNIAKLISNLTFYIGYIMAAFTEKKQALHDIIAHTLVLKKVS